MTTSVTITPSGHPVLVKVIDGETETEETLDPDAPQRTFYVYVNRSITISEAPLVS